MSDYRQRIYRQYLEAGANTPAAEKLAEFRDRAAYLTKLIRDHFPEDKETAILDLGCGAGAMEFFARQQGYKNIVGIDRSPQQVAAAKILGLTGVREGDLLAVLESLEDNSQGVLVVFDVLEHFRKDEALMLLDQVYRVLAPQGTAILHVPNGASPFGGRVGYGDFTHEAMFTRDSLEQILICAGFTRFSCYEDQPVIHGLASWVRWLLWRVVRGGLRLYLAIETGSLAGAEIFSQNLLCVAIK